MGLSGGIALDIEAIAVPLRILRLDSLACISPSEEAAFHQRIVARNPGILHIAVHPVAGVGSGGLIVNRFLRISDVH